MTKQKSFKRLVRARAAKTGESYSAARHQVVRAGERSRGSEPQRKAATTTKTTTAATETTRSTSSTQSKGVSNGAVSNERVLEHTGHDLEHWYRVLDAFGAKEKGHTAAARHLRQDHGVSGWHSQGITVAYERARGLRAVNQTTSGFEVSVSRVLPVSDTAALAAFTERARRQKWLADVAADGQRSVGADVERGIAAALEKKREFNTSPSGAHSLRFKDGNATIVLYVVARKDGRSQVVAQATRLAGAEQVDVYRARYKAVLDALRTYLS